MIEDSRRHRFGEGDDGFGLGYSVSGACAMPNLVTQNAFGQWSYDKLAISSPWNIIVWGEEREVRVENHSEV